MSMSMSMSISWRLSFLETFAAHVLQQPDGRRGPFLFLKVQCLSNGKMGTFLILSFQMTLKLNSFKGVDDENPPYDRCLPKTQSSTEPSSGLGTGRVQPPLCSSALEREIFLGGLQ